MRACTSQRTTVRESDDQAMAFAPMWENRLETGRADGWTYREKPRAQQALCRFRDALTRLSHAAIAPSTTAINSARDTPSPARTPSP